MLSGGGAFEPDTPDVIGGRFPEVCAEYPVKMERREKGQFGHSPQVYFPADIFIDVLDNKIDAPDILPFGW